MVSLDFSFLLTSNFSPLWSNRRPLPQGFYQHFVSARTGCASSSGLLAGHSLQERSASSSLAPKGLCGSCPTAGGLPLCSEVASSLALWSPLPPHLVSLTACSLCSVVRTGIFGFLPVLAVRGCLCTLLLRHLWLLWLCVGCGGAEVCSLIPHSKLQQVYFFCQMIIWFLVSDSLWQPLGPAL